MKHAIKYILLNAVFWACIYFAIFREATWARNLVYFWVALSFLLSLAAFHDATRKTIAARMTMPLWVHHAWDWPPIVLFVAFGWWWCAAAYFWQLSAQAWIYDEKAKLEKKAA